MSWFTDLTGGPQTTTTETVVTDDKKTNWGLIIGGIIVGVGAIAALAWAFGAFKKKPSAAA